MIQKKGAAEATPLKDKSKDTKFNSYIIDVLISICVFAIGYLSGIVGGLTL